MTIGLGHAQVWWADLDDDKVRPVANLDNTQLIDVHRLLQRIGTVGFDRPPHFCEAMQRVMGCPRS